MRTLGRLSGIMLLGTVVAQPAAARDTGGWDDASTVARNVLIVAALGVPAAKHDWHGALQAGGSVGAAFAVTAALKESFPERRPDGSNRKSFPSGHTSTAFAAAATLHNRYGWKVGIPAQAVAAFVGVARVEARKHHWYDVVAGAAIGEASGFLITSRRDATVRVLPWGDGRSGGLLLSAQF
ncbi:phosphatase PAP2 family protein [Roseomonas aeriglobus]|nr:phosphatase PAP2 family protein [Roseomonas aeriglobus]